MDSLVESHYTGDGGAARIPDFPHLRADRFLASFSGDALSLEALAQWTEGLRRIDETARASEAANLPPAARARLSNLIPFDESLEEALERCGKRLVERDLQSPGPAFRLAREIDVPDAYQTWKRVAGLYAVTRYAGLVGIDRLHRKLSQSFRQSPSELPVQGRLIRYAPPHAPSLRAEQVAEVLARARDNPLRIPQPSHRQLERLFDTFAPVWEIDTRDRNDQIGTVSLKSGGRIWINTTSPTVYRAHDFARFKGDILLQLVYQIWLPARPKSGLLDLYGGKLDSVIWRVTLGPDGRPVAYDSIHACGCYYMLFPAPGYRSVPPADNAEQVLAPVTAPAVRPGEKMALRLENTTHYIQQIYVESTFDADRVHSWSEADTLRSLPLPDGRRRSFFAPDGLVPASRRAERFLLWPFGVPSPGAMRQWGTHAIAFIGRRHFDDPFLLQNLLAPD